MPHPARGGRRFALSGNVRGALWLLAAALSFSAMNGLIKGLGSDIHAFQMAFFRSLFGLLVVAPFALSGGWRTLSTGRPGLHLLRGLFGVAAMLCTFYALANLPLATAVTILFAKPLFMIVLAVLFLGETVRWRRWLATAVGFAGVLLMVRPAGGGEAGPAMVALLAALLTAVVLVLIKKMTATERPAAVLFYFSVSASIGTLGPALAVWTTPPPMEFALLLAMGAFGSLGQYFGIRAFHAGEATAVAPVDYSTLLFSGLIGYVAFAEIPDRETVIGGAIVVTSTLYIVIREARQAAGRQPLQ